MVALNINFRCGITLALNLRLTIKLINLGLLTQQFRPLKTSSGSVEAQIIPDDAASTATSCFPGQNEFITPFAEMVLIQYVDRYVLVPCFRS